MLNPNVFSHMFLELSNLSHTELHNRYFGIKGYLKPHLLNLYFLESPLSLEGRKEGGDFNISAYVCFFIQLCECVCVWVYIVVL